MTLEVFFDALEDIAKILFPDNLDNVDALITRISLNVEL